MDDLQRELWAPQADFSTDTWENERSQTTLKQTALLHVSPTEGQHNETGFRKSTRSCLHAIRDAILRHCWKEAAQYLGPYTQTLEDTSVSKQSVACEIIWRLGTEVLRHHPSKELENFNALYERMKNTGVKNYAKICLEHTFHLLLNGHIHQAKQQLSVAMSWRYGKQSASQSLELKLIHAYCGFLDYLIWSTKRASTSDAENQHSENKENQHSIVHLNGPTIDHPNDSLGHSQPTSSETHLQDDSDTLDGSSMKVQIPLPFLNQSDRTEEAFRMREVCGNNVDMHSYFKQASVTLQEIIKQPGVWDPFVCSCLDMLEFYNDEEEALQLLQNYAYSKDYPPNPNAHIYLYKHQKKHKASPAQLIKTLKVLHSLAPSHELMLEYCTLLRNLGEKNNLQHALGVAMNLLEYTCWKTDLNAWTCLLEILTCLKKNNLRNLIKEEWGRRRDLWLKMHYKTFHGRTDSKRNTKLIYVKIKVLQLFGIYNSRYNMMYYQGKKKKRTQA